MSKNKSLRQTWWRSVCRSFTSCFGRKRLAKCLNGLQRSQPQSASTAAARNAVRFSADVSSSSKRIKVEVLSPYISPIEETYVGAGDTKNIMSKGINEPSANVTNSSSIELAAIKPQPRASSGDIEERNSFTLHKEENATSNTLHHFENSSKEQATAKHSFTLHSHKSCSRTRSRSPTITEIKMRVRRDPMFKWMEFPYECSDQDLLKINTTSLESGSGYMEDSNSFVLQEGSNATPNTSHHSENSSKEQDTAKHPFTLHSHKSCSRTRSRSPTITEIKKRVSRNPMFKWMESPYERSDQDLLKKKPASLESGSGYMEDSNSFDLQEGSNATPNTSHHSENSSKEQATAEDPFTLHSHKSCSRARSRSPTITEIKKRVRRDAMFKWMESPYACSDQDLLKNNTTSLESGSGYMEDSNSFVLQEESNRTRNTSVPLLQQQRPPEKVYKSSSKLRATMKLNARQKQKASPKIQQKTSVGEPCNKILKAVAKLASTEWEIITSGLQEIPHLMRTYPDEFDNEIRVVCFNMTNSINNLRSQVAHAACHTATELFTYKSKNLEQNCYDLVCALLQRSTDINSFLRTEATCALESMCDNFKPIRVLNILTTKAATHRNASVRAMGAKLLLRLAERLGSDGVLQIANGKLENFFTTCANLLLDGSLETRNNIKSLLKLLSTHQKFNQLLIQYTPERSYFMLKNTLDKIH